MTEWPKHLILTLHHNDHKAFYQTLAQRLNDDFNGYYEDAFISEEEKKLCIDNDECWTIHWYPLTPNGFIVLHGYNLDKVIEAAINAAA